jgi:methyl-accepting chemotaxis protein
MIDKIKKIWDSANEVDEINSLLKSTKEEVEKMKKSVSELNKNFESKSKIMDEKIGKIVGDNEAYMQSLKKVSEEFVKELNDFKVMKTKLQRDVIEQVSSDIKKELSMYIMNVKSHIESLNSAAKEIETVAKNSGKMMASMDKLNAISSEIKKEDFELSKHAQMLRQNDHEKLELLRKIDTLERLISQMRRRQN